MKDNYCPDCYARIIIEEDRMSREIDKLIAEHVMGQTEKEYSIDGKQCCIGSRSPHYSTNIADAWDVLSKFKIFEICSLPGKISAAVYDTNYTNKGFACEDTAPMAIAKAILAAKGIEV